jgi:hypothetical protein
VLRANAHRTLRAKAFEPDLALHVLEENDPDATRDAGTAAAGSHVISGYDAAR